MKVGEMTVEQLRALIAEVVDERLATFLADGEDGDATIMDDFLGELRSLLDAPDGTVSLDDAKRRLGLE